MSNQPHDRSLQSAYDARENMQYNDASTGDWWVSQTVRTVKWQGSFPFKLAIWNSNPDNGRSAFEDFFVLPIPPSAMSISTPFASTVSATFGGVIEENNGAPFRNITLQGSTGMAPLKGGPPNPFPISSPLDSLFGGTIQAGLGVASAAGDVLGIKKAKNLIFDPFDGETAAGTVAGTVFTGALDTALAGAGGSATDDSRIPAVTSGAYQFLLLRRYLESYAHRKKTGELKGKFLALCIYKENIAYICTPLGFDLQRSAASPMEYNYSLSLKAWRRVSLGSTAPQMKIPKRDIRQPNLWAEILNRGEAVRRVFEKSQATVMAARMDVKETIFEPLRLLTLGAKDVLGTVKSVIDFPADLTVDIVADFGRNAGFGSVKDVERYFQDMAGDTADKYRKVTSAEFWNAANDRLMNGDVGTTNPVHGAQSVKSTPSSDWPLPPPDMLSPEVRARIAEEERKAAALERSDYETFRDNTLRVLGDFSRYVGAGDDSFSRTYGKSDVSVGKSEPDEEDWEVLAAMSELATLYDLMASSYAVKQSTNLIDFIAGLASSSGIAFTTPRSKFLVPFPYGFTLEKLAERYLGNPDRWVEIAALNGLRAPYIDETGFQLDLSLNGSGNTVWVATSNSFYVGQSVWIGSATLGREKRRVVEIRRVSDTDMALTLDGAADLDRYLITNAAYLQGFLPDTVNSMQFVYIPSDREPGLEDYRIKKVAGVDYYDPYVKTGGVELLLDANNDLVITPSGTRLAVGLTNIIQRARLALGTQKGWLMRHPDYGIGVKPGTSTADISAAELLASARQMFGNDPAFAGLDFAKINKSGNSLSISLGIRVTSDSVAIPVTIDLRR